MEFPGFVPDRTARPWRALLFLGFAFSVVLEFGWNGNRVCRCRYGAKKVFLSRGFQRGVSALQENAMNKIILCCFGFLMGALTSRDQTKHERKTANIDDSAPT